VKLLSHRGYWKHAVEKNTETAFRRSFSFGFGTETDIRDYGGELVVSHDPPSGGEMPFSKLLAIYAEYAANIPLALNVKADGLQSMLVEYFKTYSGEWFFFDMSVPDALGYVKAGLPVFARVSEYEKVPCFYEEAVGIWIDSFHCDWYDEDILESFLADDKSICIVSPELHGRDHLALWKRLSRMRCCRESKISICTDLPDVAAVFFGENMA